MQLGKFHCAITTYPWQHHIYATSESEDPSADVDMPVQTVNAW